MQFKSYTHQPFFAMYATYHYSKSLSLERIIRCKYLIYSSSFHINLPLWGDTHTFFASLIHMVSHCTTKPIYSSSTNIDIDLLLEMNFDTDMSGWIDSRIEGE